MLLSVDSGIYIDHLEKRIFWRTYCNESDGLSSTFFKQIGHAD